MIDASLKEHNNLTVIWRRAFCMVDDQRRSTYN